MPLQKEILKEVWTEDRWVVISIINNVNSVCALLIMLIYILVSLMTTPKSQDRWVIHQCVCVFVCFNLCLHIHIQVQTYFNVGLKVWEHIENLFFFFSFKLWKFKTIVKEKLFEINNFRDHIFQSLHCSSRSALDRSQVMHFTQTYGAQVLLLIKKMATNQIHNILWNPCYIFNSISSVMKL